jgi:hypothetical protein
MADDGSFFVALRALKPKEKDFKVADRDGMYVHVTTKGAMSFRLDYRLHGRRETLYLGKYGPDGISLARAREKCVDARRSIADGVSPAIEKQREKRRIKEAKSFGEFGEKWLQAAPWEFSTLLHFIDGAVSQRDHLAQLLASDSPP